MTTKARTALFTMYSSPLLDLKDHRSTPHRRSGLHHFQSDFTALTFLLRNGDGQLQHSIIKTVP